jgi:hypothetical protein
MISMPLQNRAKHLGVCQSANQSTLRGMKYNSLPKGQLGIRAVFGIWHDYRIASTPVSGAHSKGAQTHLACKMSDF